MLFCFKIPYVRKVLDDPIVHGENPTFGIVKPQNRTVLGVILVAEAGLEPTTSGL